MDLCSLATKLSPLSDLFPGSLVCTLLAILIALYLDVACTQTGIMPSPYYGLRQNPVMTHDLCLLVKSWYGVSLRGEI